MTNNRVVSNTPLSKDFWRKQREDVHEAIQSVWSSHSVHSESDFTLQRDRLDLLARRKRFQKLFEHPLPPSPTPALVLPQSNPSLGLRLHCALGATVISDDKSPRLGSSSRTPRPG